MQCATGRGSAQTTGCGSGHYLFSWRRPGAGRHTRQSQRIRGLREYFRAWPLGGKLLTDAPDVLRSAQCGNAGDLAACVWGRLCSPGARHKGAGTAPGLTQVWAYRRVLRSFPVDDLPGLLGKSRCPQHVSEPYQPFFTSMWYSPQGHRPKRSFTGLSLKAGSTSAS